MDSFNLDELMDLAEAYVGPMIDAIYRRLIDRDFALEDPEVVILLTALINILGHDNRGDRPTEVLLMAAYGERGVLDRPNMRVMRWRNGALSGSDRTLTGATLEMEILSQCGESTMKDFKPSPMNHGKGSVAGQLIPVEYNRLTVSETVSIDEPIGGYMEMLEYRNSARGYVMSLEDGKAMEGYLETMLQGTTLKQKAYGT